MKKRSYHIISNVIICTMLLGLFMFTINIDSDYVFSYSNPNVIYNGNTNSNKVSLMINIYWGNEYIDGMLDVLDQYNVKTTFFVGGSWVVKNPDLLKKIHDRGHEIANHGYFHKDQNKLSYDQNINEIEKCHQVVKELINVDMKLFAPPSGAFNQNTLNASNDLGYQTIMWSLDTIDWRDQDTALIFKRATKNISGGDLVLMHPTAATVSILPAIIDEIKQKGLILTTVSDIIENKNY